MLLKGEWYPCPDDVLRPVLRGRAQSSDGSWVRALVLLDTGADRTVFSAELATALSLAPLTVPEGVVGIGGRVESVVVEARLQFPREDGTFVTFQGRYAATTDPNALDMSVLGRDLTNHFAVIVDRPGDTVCLVGQAHGYRIEQR